MGNGSEIRYLGSLPGACDETTMRAPDSCERSKRAVLRPSRLSVGSI